MRYVDIPVTREQLIEKVIEVPVRRDVHVRDVTRVEVPYERVVQVPRPYPVQKIVHREQERVVHVPVEVCGVSSTKLGTGGSAVAFSTPAWDSKSGISEGRLCHYGSSSRQSNSKRPSKPFGATLFWAAFVSCLCKHSFPGRDRPLGVQGQSG